MHPISASLEVAEIVRNLLGELAERWARAENIKMDAEAPVRPLFVKRRHEFVMLEVAVGQVPPMTFPSRHALRELIRAECRSMGA